MGVSFKGGSLGNKGHLFKYLRTLRYLYLFVCFHFKLLLHITFKRDILYFVLHYICLPGVAISYFPNFNKHNKIGCIAIIN